jgi:hypothetical protein
VAGAAFQQGPHPLGAAIAALADEHQRALGQVGLVQARQGHVEAAGDVAGGVFHRFAHVDHGNALAAELFGQVLGADAFSTVGAQAGEVGSIQGAVGHGEKGRKWRWVGGDQLALTRSSG